MSLYLPRKSKGFTLIELMIVVAIVGIIAAIGYPAYTESVRKTKRSDAHSALTTAAAQQERYFTVNNAYTTDMSKIGGADSTEGYYTISSSVSGRTYTLTATAVSGTSQAADTGCTSLTLTNTGAKAPADCW